MKDGQSHEIAVFNPGLKDAPGWIALSTRKRDELWQIASENHQFRQMKGLGEFGELMTLYQASQILEGEELQLRDYIARIYPERHYRTVLRKEKNFEAFVQHIPSAVLKRLSSLGTEVLDRFDRIASAALGDIRNAVKELPVLSATTEQDAEKYLEELDGKLYDQQRRKGKPASKSEENATKEAANALISLGRSCRLKTSAQKRAFLQRAAGWYMEAEAVSGTPRIHRLPLPEGVPVKRGRPQKQPTGGRREAAPFPSAQLHLQRKAS